MRIFGRRTDVRSTEGFKQETVMASWTLAFIFAAQLQSLCAMGPAGSAPLVHTNSGPVEGLRLKGGGKDIDAYFGIPFAEPPIGERRFQKPSPVTPWKDVLQATRKRQGCVQTNFFVFKDVELDMSNTTEDCLYMNIWVPRRRCNDNGGVCDKPLPVFAFIYGGIFAWGSSSLYLYDGLEFAARTEVIYVNFNYRVGILGFMNASSPEAPGNMGLYDQLEALRWVHKNIQFFGGDPDAVTLAGQSAGAMSVTYHMMSQLSKGLFHRAVLFSGTPQSLAYSDYVDHRQNFRILSQALNCTDESRPFVSQIADSVECLRQVEAHDLVIRGAKALSFRFVTVLPGYGDEFLTHSPIELESSDMHVKSVFVGTTKDDGAYLVSQMLSRMHIIRDQLDGPTAFMFALKSFMNIDYATSRRLAQEYFDDSGTHEQWEVEKSLSIPITDGGFDCGTSFFAAEAINQNATVYRYVFEYRPSYSFWPQWITATHADELPFVLGTVRAPRQKVINERGPKLEALLRNYNPTPDELLFSDDLLGTLAMFCKTG
ncbi:unnamed protein product [Ixodes hexagonus]